MSGLPKRLLILAGPKASGKSFILHSDPEGLELPPVWRDAIATVARRNLHSTGEGPAEGVLRLKRLGSPIDTEPNQDGSVVLHLDLLGLYNAGTNFWNSFVVTAFARNREAQLRSFIAAFDDVQVLSLSNSFRLNRSSWASRRSRRRGGIPPSPPPCHFYSNLRLLDPLKQLAQLVLERRFASSESNSRDSHVAVPAVSG